MYFPTYSLKNFYENPRNILEFSKTCNYHRSEEGRWPGARSDCLSTINPQLFHYSCDKIMKMIFGKNDFSYTAINQFQLIKNEDINNSESGFAHKDPNILTAIIYLSENNNSSGTQILNNPTEGYIENEYLSERYNSENKENEKKIINNKYTDFLHHNSLFNSLLVFQGANPHKAVFDIKDKSERLTQIIFFQTINSSWFPIPEMNSRA